MREGLDNLSSRNPLSRVQSEIAKILRDNEWVKSHNVEVIEQNSQALSFLLQKSAAQINNVIVIVGVDDFENNPPVLETTVTITATENVIMNRQRADSVTALDVMQVAIELIDGQDWCFQEAKHESPAQGILQASSTFKGQVLRTTEINSLKEGE